MRRYPWLPLLMAVVMCHVAHAFEIVFDRDVKPILAKCMECHGDEQRMGTLRLDSREGALVGGRAGVAIIPGDADRSRVYLRVSGKADGPQMPPTGPLKAEEIATLKSWINEGAKWPEASKPEPAWRVDSRLSGLFAQIRGGEIAAVKRSVDADKSLSTARDAEGRTLLMMIALWGSATDLRWLLERGADPNAVSLAGLTALMLAVDDAEKVRFLVGQGADVSLKSREGQTALRIAADTPGNRGSLQLLLDKGSDAGAGMVERDALTAAARSADVGMLQLLLSKYKGEVPGGALNASTVIDCLPCIRLLIKHGAPKRSVNSALRLAAIGASMETLRELLGAATDVNAQSSEGMTALMGAAYRDWVEPARVKLLLSRGANVNAKDGRGNTALSLAKQRGSAEIVKLLVEAGAKE